MEGQKMFNEILYPGMTETDAESIEKENARNDWGITTQELRELVDQHQAARAVEDSRTMSMIVFRLEDINFHTIASLLDDGKYDDAIDWIWYDM